MFRYLIVALFALLQPSESFADIRAEPVVLRAHRMIVHGRELRYTSHAGRIAVSPGGIGPPGALMFYIAYRVAPDPGHARPLTVIWNGGPGGSMLSMLLGGQGPKRIEGGAVIDNGDTLLADTDLLYIDAVGSGFSRLTRPQAAAAFYQTKGDNDAFTECILGWLRLNRAQRQTVYLAGISWGAYRVAAVADALASRGVEVGGGVIMSGRNGLARPGAERRFLPLGIVHYPRVAMLHGGLPARSPDGIDQIEADAKSWAKSDYLPALSRITDLSPTERESVARRLSAYSGLPLSKIDRQTLVVTPRMLTEQLLADEGRKLAPFDLRQVVGGANVAPQARPSSGETYLRTELGYSTSQPYLPLVWDTDRNGYPASAVQVPPPWNYLRGYYADTLDDDAHARANEVAASMGYPPGGQEVPLGEQVMRIKPAMRFLVLQGRYDALGSSCTSIEAQLDELPADLRKRVTFRCVDGGHALFIGDAAIRREVNAEIRILLGQRN